MIAVALAAVAGGCTTVVTPPPQPHDPVTVLIVDFGRHSSLIFPGESGGRVEFASGEWHWFALGRDQCYRIPAVLLWPTQSALGLREHEDGLDDAIARAVEAEHYFSIQVERTRAETLRNELQAQYDAAAAEQTPVVNDELGLTFVPDERPYCLLCNCNHRTSEWLRALGCRVGPTANVADFTIRPPAARSDE